MLTGRAKGSGPPRSNGRVVLVGAALATGLSVLLELGGALEPIETALLDMRYARIERPIAAPPLLVAIDRHSLDTIGVWPWPRRLHGLVLDRLMAAGAEAVHFDVDFSAVSVAAEDAAFARALARATPPATLAVFSEATDDGEVPVGPLPDLIAVALPAVVDVTPSRDGHWRMARPMRSWRGAATPALFARLSPDALRHGDYLIDYGLDPTTIPTLSFVDVASGAFDPAEVRGRQVLVGATALELGDTVAVPRFGVLPGAVAQILAAASADEGRMLWRPPVAATALGAAVAAAAALGALRRPRWTAAVAVTTGLGALVLGIALVTQSVSPLLLDIVPVWTAIALAVPIAYGHRVGRLDRHVRAQSRSLRRAAAVSTRIAAHMNDGLVIVDETGRIAEANPAARALLRIRNRARMAPLPAYCARPVLRGRFVDALSTAPPTGARIVARRADRSPFVAELSISRLPPGDTRRDGTWMVVFRDVTAQARAARDAQRREQVLRTLTLRAEAATRTKTEFVAAMSHELRTPLNGVIGLASMMRDEAFGPLGSDRYRQFAVEIGASGARLLRLLTHILDYANAEIDRLAIDPQPLDLAELARETVDLQRMRAEVAQVRLVLSGLDTPLAATLDRAAIQKSLGNVVANAIRVTPAGGSVAIALLLHEPGWADLHVRDTGPGMSPEMLARCFEPFVQGDRTAGFDREGGGLGLTVARAFIARHGGTIALCNRAGGGLLATIRLPLNGPPETA